MTSSPNKLVFFGNERLATGVTTNTPTLRALVEAGYQIGAIVANHMAATSRKQRELEVETFARDHNIPFYTPHRVSELEDMLAACEAPIGVLVAYGKLVPQSIIDLFPHGIINLHPSLLPLHRGPIPVESVILAGAKETGVSIMELVREMDAGPVYVQEKVSLRGDESKQELADLLLGVGSRLLVDSLPGILTGSITPVNQDDSHATYDARLSREQGTIDWNTPAAHIERRIRACLGWPGSRAMFYGRDVVITGAHVGDTTHMRLGEDRHIGEPFKTSVGELAVTTGQGELIIDTLTPAGKRSMTGAEFLAGVRI